MKKIIMGLLALTIFATLPVVTSTPAHAGSDKIGICHATGSGKYNQISVDKSSLKVGHSGHGDDIVPAFDWIENKTRMYFDGLNLDKAGLLTTGCVAPATVNTAMPHNPTYTAPMCTDASHPYGVVTVPNDLGLYIKGASAPVLSADHKTWTVTYTKLDDTDSMKYVWGETSQGVFTFAVGSIENDPLYVMDSRTGKGACELSNTGVGSINSIALTAAGGLLVLGVLALIGTTIARRRMV